MKMAERIKTREVGAKAYAEATGYYTPFHEGLNSESANSIRNGVDAAIRAAMDQSVKDAEFTDLLMAVNRADDPLKAALPIIGAMAAVIEIRRGKQAVRQLFEEFAAQS